MTPSQFLFKQLGPFLMCQTSERSLRGIEWKSTGLQNCRVFCAAEDEGWPRCDLGVSDANKKDDLFL